MGIFRLKKLLPNTRGRYPARSVSGDFGHWGAKAWRLLSALAVALFCISSGCSGPAISSHARTPFLDSHDLISMTDKMAANIAANPGIDALTARRPMIIVLDNLKNETNEIITRGQGDAFLQRMQVLLASEPTLRTRFIFVINPAARRRLVRQGIAPAGATGLTPQYALQAVFYADTKVAQAYRSDYYLCTFFLTNIRTGKIAWEGSYETKKDVDGSFLY